MSLKFYRDATKSCTYTASCLLSFTCVFAECVQALLALKEALKYVIKAKPAPGKTEKLEGLDQRIR